MSDDNVLLLHDLSREAASAILNDIASNHSERIINVFHARQRKEERDISQTQILCCLKNGVFIDEPFWNNEKRNWEMTIETISAGDCIRLGVALGHDKEGNKAIIITAIKRK